MKIKPFSQRHWFMWLVPFFGQESMHFPKGFFKKCLIKIFHPFFIGLLHVFKAFFTKPLIWAKKKGPFRILPVFFASSASEVWAALGGSSPDFACCAGPCWELQAPAGGLLTNTSSTAFCFFLFFLFFFLFVHSLSCSSLSPLLFQSFSLLLLLPLCLILLLPG